MRTITIEFSCQPTYEVARHWQANTIHGGREGRGSKSLGVLLQIQSAYSASHGVAHQKILFILVCNYHLLNETVQVIHIVLKLIYVPLVRIGG